MANSLTLGCDCLGEIHYLDDVFADEHGKPRTRANAICMHEEDYGILWKHVDLPSGRTEVRRSRRLVISSIATVGQLRVRLLLVLLPRRHHAARGEADRASCRPWRVDGDDPGPHANMIAPGLAAPFHQHLFNVRLDIEIDGPDNAVFEVDTLPSPPGEDNPWSNAFAPMATLLETELAARRDVDPSRSRIWKIVNRSKTERCGPARRPTSCCRPRPRRCWPIPDRASGAGLRFAAAQPLGHPLRRGRAPGRRRLPQPAHRGRRACPRGRPGTGRSSTPTSWCGTPSESPTCPGPRTGR